MHSRARSCPPPPDKSLFVRLGIMIKCLAGLRMRHLEEQGGLRGLSGSGTPAFPSADGQQRRRVPASRYPVHLTSSLLLTLHVPMWPPPPPRIPTCARNPPALSRFTDNPLVFPANRLSFNHPLTPLNLSRRGVFPLPPSQRSRVCSRFP